MHPHSTPVTAKLSIDCKTQKTHWFHTIAGFEADGDQVYKPLGFDVALYDTDAIILKNPELLYYKQYGDSDIIGTYGHFPQQIMQEWGLAICIGVAVFKSTTHRGKRHLV